ncbi:MAG: hypothetical protein CME24_16445 [Gemmatimonadetes bacterium]|nr:hypothetical protein [Gemmatimonadota bacterium]
MVARLPDILERCVEKGDLELGPATKEIKANYVGYATMPDGREVVIKVGLQRHIYSEARALRVWDGHGINRLIDHDRELSAMLLERFQPGTMLRELDDPVQQAQICGRIMRQLHETSVPDQHDFPHVGEKLAKTFGHRVGAGLLRCEGRIRPNLQFI